MAHPRPPRSIPPRQDALSTAELSEGRSLLRESLLCLAGEVLTKQAVHTVTAAQLIEFAQELEAYCVAPLGREA